MTLPPLTADERLKLRELCERATRIHTKESPTTDEEWDAVYAFQRASREAVPRLLDECNRLHAELTDVRVRMFEAERQRDEYRKGGFDGIDAMADKLGKAEAERDAAIRERDEALLVPGHKIVERNACAIEMDRQIERSARLESLEQAAREWSRYGRDDADDEDELLKAVRALDALPAISALDSAKEKP